MTWRAFIIGLLGAVGLCLLTPINDFAMGNTYLTGNHFPVGVVFALLILTLVVNVVIKLVNARWALRQSELMLVWCMMLVSANVPSSGLMRYWFPSVASAPYLAQRSDLYWEDDVLQVAPEGILLSNDPKSVAARKFYDGTPMDEVVRVPWGRWTRVIASWSVFIWLYYLATFFLFGMLRRQWVESERLMFPLARVPLEFTEGSGSRRILPPLFRSRAFLVGALLAVVFGIIRLSPLFLGAEEGMRLRLPVNQVFADTDWSLMHIHDGWIYPIGIGFAFLVPSDISLSMWFFYLFTRGEVLGAYYMGTPLEEGPWGPFLQWQQAGAFVALTVGMLWATRRHLWRVFRKAVGFGAPVSDADEPIGYRLCFWGLLVCVAGMIAWYMYFGMSFLAAVFLLALIFSIVLVHARLVAQGGLFFTQQGWSPPDILHGITGGRAFSGAATVVAQVQHAIFISDAREILAPHAMNSLRISSVFEKHRRLFLPIMLVTLLAGMMAAGYSTLRLVYYKEGALNVKQTYAVMYKPLRLYDRTHLMLDKPAESVKRSYGGLASGVGLMAVLVVLRGRFYWWPIHALGFAVANSWCITQLWFCFLLGWLVKVIILKFGSGGILRGARMFFLGVIMAESAMVACTTLFSLVTGIRTGSIFLSN